MAAILCITGNLTKDPKMEQIGAQNACKFSVAVRTRAKDANGGYKTNFYDCTYFGKLAEGFCARAQKGTGVTVFGDLAADAYLSSGEPRPALRLTVSNVEAMSRLKEAGSAAPAPAADDSIPPF